MLYFNLIQKKSLGSQHNNKIDLSRDGFIDKEDLHDMLASLGKDPTDEYLEDMMNEAPGRLLQKVIE